MALESVKEQLRTQKETVVSYLKSEPTLLLTLTYLALTAVGLLYSSEFYSRFGIQYTDYAQTGDFLMASLKEPFIILIFVGSVLVMYLLFRLDFWMRARYGWYNWMYDAEWFEKLTYNPVLIVILILVYVELYTGMYASYAVRQIRNGDGPVVVVERDTEDGTREVPRTLLGTTGGFVFLYDVETGTARAIPHENVLSLRHAPADSNEASQSEPESASEAGAN